MSWNNCNTKDNAKSGNPLSITANPNIEPNRDTTFSKIKQNFLVLPNYIDTTQRCNSITIGEEENNYLDIDSAENPTTSPNSIVQNRHDIVTARSNNVQRKNSVSTSVENDTSGLNGNENVTEIITLADTEPHHQSR